jgi:SpoVK/Ycf46/Vps4 family AAA+-type ATPase
MITSKNIDDIRVNTNMTNSIIIIEDIDLIVSKQREGDSVGRDNLHKLLNVLDKATKVIITTNKPEDIDSALKRSGRVDKVFHIDYLDKKDSDKVILFVFYKYLNSVFGNSKNIVLDSYNPISYYEDKIDWLKEDVYSKLKPHKNGKYAPCDLVNIFNQLILEYLKSSYLNNNNEDLIDFKYIEQEVGLEVINTINKRKRDISDGMIDFAYNFSFKRINKILKESITNDDCDDDDEDDRPIYCGIFSKKPSGDE